MLEYDLRLEYELNCTEREIVEYNDCHIDDDRSLMRNMMMKRKKIIHLRGKDIVALFKVGAVLLKRSPKRIVYLTAGHHGLIMYRKDDTIFLTVPKKTYAEWTKFDISE